MFFKKNNTKFTQRDMDILEILWDSPEPLTASGVVKQKEGLTANTVQAVLRKLLKNQMIEVADIVYSGTVLSRSYRASITREEFLASQFAEEARRMEQKIQKTALVAALFEQEQDEEKARQEIEELEVMLKEYKKRF